MATVLKRHDKLEPYGKHIAPGGGVKGLLGLGPIFLRERKIGGATPTERVHTGDRSS